MNIKKVEKPRHYRASLNKFPLSSVQCEGSTSVPFISFAMSFGPCPVGRCWQGNPIFDLNIGSGRVTTVSQTGMPMQDCAPIRRHIDRNQRALPRELVTFWG